MKLIQSILGVWLVALVCTACSAQPEPPPFNHEKAKALTPERRMQLDVAFFNDYEARGSSASALGRHDALPRKERIHALAEEGFELAYIAEQIFDFKWGFKQENTDLRKWWGRVHQLAAQDDTSALCIVKG